jgi:hypothetical protein
MVGGEATPDDKLLKIDKTEGDKADSENGQSQNVEKAGG